MGTSQAAKAESHDRILDIAAARLRRDGVGGLTVAELMKEAGLTHGGFYRHFESREHLLAEATSRALASGSEWTRASGEVGGHRGFEKLIDGYLSPWHRDNRDIGCGVAALAADVTRAGGGPRSSYTRQVRECLDVIEAIDNDGAGTGDQRREAILILSSMVGAISMARAVDDPELSEEILRSATAGIKMMRDLPRMPNPRTGRTTAQSGHPGP
jgi:TetR/AcrR family transcriptional repressor of nem operon